MAKLDTDEFLALRDTLAGKLIGLETLRSAPANQSDGEVLRELEDAIRYLRERMAEINATATAIDNLFKGGYPDYRTEEASAKVIKQLAFVAKAAAAAAGGFIEPAPTADALEVKLN